MNYVVYHGTGVKFSKFNLKKTTQGIIWFTDNKDAIEKREVGAQGKGYILKCEIKLVNPCGWNEYEKYGIGQLKGMGYDGIILPDEEFNTYIVFEPKQIKILEKQMINEKVTLVDKILLEAKTNKTLYHLTSKVVSDSFIKTEVFKPSLPK